MTQTQHTPGPWEAWDDGYTVGITDDEGEPFAVLEIVDHGDMADPAQILADQRLASAAPDLRNALADMIEMATHHAMPEDERLIILRAARTALAKARGEG